MSQKTTVSFEFSGKSYELVDDPTTDEVVSGCINFSCFVPQPNTYLKRSQQRALKELKDKLRSSGVSDSDSIWGVPLLKGDDRADVVLLKFLRIKHFKVADAIQMLHKCLSWRKESKVDNILDEKFLFEDHLHDFAYIHEYDRNQHPVCYIVYGDIKDKGGFETILKDRDRREKFVRWRIHLLERAIGLLDFKIGGVDSITEVYDLKEMPNGELLTACVQFQMLLLNYYPWITSRKIFINAPWYTSVRVLLAYPFLIESDKWNLVVSTKGKTAKTLLRFIPPHHVPVQYDGLSLVKPLKEMKVSGPAKEMKLCDGKTMVIDIRDVPAGATSSWEILVVGGKVKYKAKFIPCALSSYILTLLTTPWAIASGEKVKIIRDSFTLPEAGRMELRLDNTASLKSKFVAFRHSYVVNKN